MAQTGSLTLDFEGVEAMTPSFVDELLGVLGEAVNDNTGEHPQQLTLLHTPTRLSEKFIAIARARDVEIAELDEGTWSVTQLSA